MAEVADTAQPILSERLPVPLGTVLVITPAVVVLKYTGVLAVTESPVTRPATRIDALTVPPPFPVPPVTQTPRNPGAAFATAFARLQRPETALTATACPGEIVSPDSIGREMLVAVVATAMTASHKEPAVDPSVSPTS
jgi:hypothetical protein